METNTVTEKKRLSTNERKLSILKALTELLMTEKGAVTTKALAAKLNISEGALYRHFPSKAKIYDALLDYAQSYFQTNINAIFTSTPSGLLQIEQIALFLVQNIKTNPSIVMLLTGDALGQEKERLKVRVNEIFNLFQSAFKQAMRNALAQNQIPATYDGVTRANMLVALVLGHWIRFAKGNTTDLPVNIQKQIRITIGLAS